MGLDTHVEFRNSEDVEFKRILENGTDDEIEDLFLENFIYDIDDRKGKLIQNSNSNSDAVQETNDEYGGFIIDLSKIPKETTHIVVVNS